MKLIDRIRRTPVPEKGKASKKASNKYRKYGGFRDRNLQAIFTPKKRGKIKGYMKA